VFVKRIFLGLSVTVICQDYASAHLSGQGKEYHLHLLLVP